MEKFDAHVHGNILPLRSLRDEPIGNKACNDAAPYATVRPRVHRIYLAAPLKAQAGAEVQTGLSSGLYMRVERTFGWEDKCKQLLLRFEHIQQRHYGMKLLGYTLINLRAFCGI